MTVTENTFNIFTNNKCGFVHMTENDILYITEDDKRMLFLYPDIGRLVMHYVIGRDNEKNMPIIGEPEKSWVVENDTQLDSLLKTICVQSLT